MSRSKDHAAQTGNLGDWLVRVVSGEFKPSITEYDRQALEGAAEYFDSIATMGNPAPLAFSQAIRHTLTKNKVTPGASDDK